MVSAITGSINSALTCTHPNAANVYVAPCAMVKEVKTHNHRLRLIAATNKEKIKIMWS